MTKFEQKLLRYMEAGFPILYLNTFEEDKARAAVTNTMPQIAQSGSAFEWDGTGAVINMKTGTPLYCTLETVLESMIEEEGRQVLVLKSIHTFLDQPQILALIKKVAMRICSEDLDAVIIIISPLLELPDELDKYITVLDMDYLTSAEIREIVKNFAEVNQTKVSEQLLQEFANDLKGLSEYEIQNILSLALTEDGELRSTQTSLIFEQKQQIIRKSGLLEMIPLKESMDDIGGLENLKDWLQRKAKIFANMDKAIAFGVNLPKGVLIAGVPGCGKSLSAKAAAKLFNMPLLRLDMGRLLGKYVGESESNMKKAIELAEAISPCVLWIDELEKAFAGIGGDGAGAEVTTRLFGSFLTWLQEKESPVFVVATANNIIDLPPELLRKGRFDEIFSVGLPNKTERKRIFEIHIKRRRPGDLQTIDLETVVSRTEGYSGADIEGVVRESVEMAFAGNKDHVSTDILLESIRNTSSLSEIMKDSIDQMKKEYSNRKFKNASREAW